MDEEKIQADYDGVLKEEDIEKIEFETKKEEKELHGWGVKIIKEIVDEAQGTIQYIKEQNNRLKVIVFLPFQ